ncbi:hypothetical protein RND71_018954 [Anisodus tanguticus]|uniref:Ubiquitin-like domain-containing protein n=1 Tax=Anisodus tanguticus TaxID=243964 RepID=A0AAE1VBG7_9SOLA|nr:hypothetical protein RND71_018954 [Anisodus tanguticus]
MEKEGKSDGDNGTTITVNLKFNGRSVPVEISNESTAKHLKSLLQPLTNVLSRGQKLIFKGSSSLAHAPTHPQDPLSAGPAANISPIEAVKKFQVDEAVEGRTRKKSLIEANPIDGSDVPAEVIADDILLQYFSSADSVPPHLHLLVFSESESRSFLPGGSRLTNKSFMP